MRTKAKNMQFLLAIGLVVAMLFSCNDDENNGTTAPNDRNDSAHHEVGVVWVTNYTWLLKNLLNSDDSANAFYNKLGNAGQIKSFNRGNSATSEDHFQWDKDDKNYIDGVDTAFYQGHGSNSELILATFSNRVGFKDEIEGGDHDLEWIALHCCYSTEKPSNFKGNYYALNRIYLICGFKTSALNYPYDGDNCVWFLLNNEKVRYAWYHAIDITHSSNYVVIIIGESHACSNDYIWGVGNVTSDPYVGACYYTKHLSTYPTSFHLGSS